MEYDLYARAVPLIFNQSFKRQLTVSFDERSAGEVMRKAQLLYREIVLRSPSIGGSKNPNLLNVFIAAFVAAIYKAAGGRLSSEQMGEAQGNRI